MRALRACPACLPPPCLPACRRWFHWTVDQFMSVFNPPNAEPLVLERVPSELEGRPGGPAAWIHTKVGKGGGGCGEHA
jgi:hypothetical protein